MDIADITVGQKLYPRHSEGELEVLHVDVETDTVCVKERWDHGSGEQVNCYTMHPRGLCDSLPAMWSVRYKVSYTSSEWIEATDEQEAEDKVIAMWENMYGEGCIEVTGVVGIAEGTATDDVEAIEDTEEEI